MDFPFLAAVIDVAISGSEVPKAIIVSPINESDILRILEILIAESTVMSAPKRVMVIAIIEIGNPKFKGFLYASFENRSVSIFVSSIFSDSEFLKLLNK